MFAVGRVRPTDPGLRAARRKFAVGIGRPTDCRAQREGNSYLLNGLYLFLLRKFFTVSLFFARRNIFTFILIFQGYNNNNNKYLIPKLRVIPHPLKMFLSREARRIFFEALLFLVRKGQPHKPAPEVGRRVEASMPYQFLCRRASPTRRRRRGETD